MYGSGPKKPTWGPRSEGVPNVIRRRRTASVSVRALGRGRRGQRRGPGAIGVTGPTGQPGRDQLARPGANWPGRVSTGRRRGQLASRAAGSRATADNHETERSTLNDDILCLTAHRPTGRDGDAGQLAGSATTFASRLTGPTGRVTRAPDPWASRTLEGQLVEPGLPAPQGANWPASRPPGRCRPKTHGPTGRGRDGAWGQLVDLLRAVGANWSSRGQAVPKIFSPPSRPEGRAKKPQNFFSPTPARRRERTRANDRVGGPTGQDPKHGARLAGRRTPGRLSALFPPLLPSNLAWSTKTLSSDRSPSPGEEGTARQMGVFSKIGSQSGLDSVARKN